MAKRKRPSVKSNTHSISKQVSSLPFSLKKMLILYAGSKAVKKYSKQLMDDELVKEYLAQQKELAKNTIIKALRRAEQRIEKI